MNLSLPSDVERLIDDRVRSGKYKSAEDVIAAAVLTLEQVENAEDFEPGELDRLLGEGEQSGPSLNGERVLEELRQLRSRTAG